MITSSLAASSRFGSPMPGTRSTFITIFFLLMARYLFAFTGPLPLPADDLRLIEQHTQLLDTSRRAVLVEANAEHQIQSLAQQLPDWTVSPENFTPVPGTRQTIRNKLN